MRPGLVCARYLTTNSSYRDSVQSPRALSYVDREGQEWRTGHVELGGLLERPPWRRSQSLVKMGHSDMRVTNVQVS